MVSSTVLLLLLLVFVVLVGSGLDCVAVLTSPGLVDPGTWNKEKEKK
jgi:hypothetical protein